MDFGWRTSLAATTASSRTRDMFVACASAENGERVIQAIVPPTGNAGGVGAGAVIFCVEKALKQPAVDDFVRFKYADGFVEFVFQVGIAGFRPSIHF